MTDYSFGFRCTDAAGITHYYNIASAEHGITTRCEAKIPWPTARPGTAFAHWYDTEVDCMACIATWARMESS